MIFDTDRFLNIIDSSEIVLFVLDRNGVINYFAGKGLEKSLSLPVDRLGKSIYDVYKSEPQFTGLVKKILAGIECDSLINIGFAGREYEGHYSLVYDAVNAIDGVVGIAVDVTEKRKKERELNLMKVNFVSMVSHEFRTPLTSILTSTHIIQKYGEKLTVAEKDENLEKIKKSVSILTSLIEDVSDYNKLQSFQPIKRLKTFDSAKFLRQIIDEEILAANKDIQVSSDIPETLLITSDELLFRQIFSNIISNALKYTPRNKTINIILRTDNLNLIFSCEDMGIGISSEIKETLFESFVRGDNTTGVKGTGLGLTIVKRAIDLLGGEISYNSKKERGTIFEIKFPKTGLVI